MYQSLQGCRALAAALVVLFHLAGTFAQDKYFGFKGIEAPFAWGDAGVDFFFVLSGFLITIAHRRDFGQPGALVRYATKRALRIYPTYWLICLAVCLAAVVVPALRYALPSDALTYIGALALIPLDPAVVGGTGSPILFVAWSLQYEMLFYAVVAVFILSRGAGMIVAAALAVAVLANQSGTTSAFPLSFFGSHMILLFAMGVASAYFVRSRFRVPFPIFVAAAAAAAFVAFGLLGYGRAPDAWLDRRLVNGALSCLIVIGLVQAEDDGALALKHRWFGLLGDSSYSLYLMHIPIISVLVKLILHFRISDHATLVVAFVLVFLACVASSVLFYQLLERPMLEWLRSRVGHALKRSPAPIAATLAQRQNEGLQ